MAKLGIMLKLNYQEVMKELFIQEIVIIDIH